MSKAIDRIKEIIDQNQDKNNQLINFVLQGGAGSGKTESLKEIIAYIANQYPDKTIACITHTNAAVDELKLRVGAKYEISTIHSFLNNLIKKYTCNLKDVVPAIFLLKTAATVTHDDYKKAYNNYAKRFYRLKNVSKDKVIGKREYDKNPGQYNIDLNKEIDDLNAEISSIIQQKNHESIKYNESRFDSFEELTFSHDSLLELAFLLAKKFELLPKIISDKYDFIFIDEYQDSSKYTIDLFLDLLPNNGKTTVGLFGDAMQGIYDDGIGSVEDYIADGKLEKIDKDDNYRCSEQVIDFINILRNDTIKQKVALKEGEDFSERTGTVNLIYALTDNKPNAFSNQETKNEYLQRLQVLIEKGRFSFGNAKFKMLVLTNKSIAKEGGFPNLYKIFDDRFTEVNEEIERELARIQVTELAELHQLFKNQAYNDVIVRIKRNGYQVKSLEDKNRISGFFSYLENEELSILKALEYAFNQKILNRSLRFENYQGNRTMFLKELENDQEFIDLQKKYQEGSNTIKRLKDNHDITLTEDEFDDFERRLKKKIFFEELFSEKVKFSEVLKYQSYLNEETDFITMHKTKGTGIENVMIVLDEYFWTKYNFKSLYCGANDDKKMRTQKLFYVACSRAKKKLVVVRMLEGLEEKSAYTNYFQNFSMEEFNTTTRQTIL